MLRLVSPIVSLIIYFPLASHSNHRWPRYRNFPEILRLRSSKRGLFKKKRISLTDIFLMSHFLILSRRGEKIFLSLFCFAAQKFCNFFFGPAGEKGFLAT